MDNVIKLSNEDLRDGITIWRELQRAHDLYHVAENDWQRWCGQMAALYRVPDGWQLTDLLRGFEKPFEKSQEAHNG